MSRKQPPLDTLEREILGAMRKERVDKKGRYTNEEIAEAKDLANNFRMTQRQLEEAKVQRVERIKNLLEKRVAMEQVATTPEFRAFMNRRNFDLKTVVYRMVMFLKAVAETGTYGHASDRSGVTTTERRFYETHCSAFREALAEAYDSFTEDLEYMGHLKAFEGNATMIMFFLKARKPQMYRDRSDMTITPGAGTGVNFIINESIMSPEEAERAKTIGKGGELVN